MPLSDKDLETFLWKHPSECATRGLAIDHNFYRFGRRYRQLSLGPYGVAPLVNVRYWPAEHAYYVQVIMFTKAALTPVLYLQAKRYLSALRDALRQALRAANISAAVTPSCVLIGQRVQMTGDFVYALNLDATCQAFTYTYGVGGLAFESVSRYWGRHGSEQDAALAQLAADLLSQRDEELADEDGLGESSSEEATEPLPQHYLAELVVTAEGILHNEAQEGAEEYE
jgi:hypothetical protein